MVMNAIHTVGGSAQDSLPTVGERVSEMALSRDPFTERLAFRRPSGVIWWLPAEHVAEFIGRHGALSAESYRARYAADWEDDFFTGRSGRRFAN